MDIYFEEKIKKITELQIQLEKAEASLLDYMSRNKKDSHGTPQVIAVNQATSSSMYNV